MNRQWKTILALVLWFVFALVLIARADVKQKQSTCGGWENWMQVVVTQDPGSSCIRKGSQITETCYTVTIQVHPGDPETCTFNYNVPQSKVDNVVKQFMNEYLP